MSSESEDEEDDTGFEMHAAVSPTVSSAAGATESLAAETAQLNPDAAASVAPKPPDGNPSVARYVRRLPLSVPS